MTGDTSISPADVPPMKGEARKTQATTEGVDAQNANEFDMKHALAGAEAKPGVKTTNDEGKGSEKPR